MLQPHDIPAGYIYGQTTVSSPVSLAELEELKKSVCFTAEDAGYLQHAGAILADQVEQILDLWYGFVGSHPHLLHAFCDAQGQPVPEYLQRVRARFGQWIRDTCLRPYDQAWLDYQHQIALRHHRTLKTQTDGVEATKSSVPLRHLIALIVPITTTIRDFLAKKEQDPDRVDKMYHAWFKAVTLQVALWSQPYAREGDH
ncbi:MAG: hypothetical protein KatS3mg113_0723 [Planctomycetaceae bacterium]|nr:MAG: hypothetical protein KatS3mg113_0723 [Planctomycetaceae bacterium]